ncbi:MAG: isochorismatase family protein [Alkalibacterium sp.]|nr:isochorismatase family protein [Alkalibacterium sp.]
METADVLVIIDMQKGICHYEDQTIADFNTIVSGINARIDAYTQSSKPVIFVRHTDEYLIKDSDKWQIISELKKTQAHYVIDKKHPNAFYKTELKYTLNKLNAKSIEICGAETQYCVDATLKFAHGLEYTILMTKGLHTSWDNEWMTAAETRAFYETIWENNFVTLF